MRFGRSLLAGATTLLAGATTLLAGATTLLVACGGRVIDDSGEGWTGYHDAGASRTGSGSVSNTSTGGYGGAPSGTGGWLPASGGYGGFLPNTGGQSSPGGGFPTYVDASGPSVGTGGTALGADAGCIEPYYPRAQIAVWISGSLATGDTEVMMTGNIVSVSPAEFTISSCAFGDCPEATWRVQIEAPDLDLTRVLPVAAPATVDYAHLTKQPNWDGFAEASHIVVSNHPPNVSATAASLYVMADNGAGFATDDPTILSAYPLSCPDGGTCSIAPPPGVDGVYRMDFLLSLPLVYPPMNAVPGEAVHASGPTGLLTFRDLSSFLSNECGLKLSRVSYWATNEPYRD